MSWDSARAAERVARAYAAPDLAAVRERQIDLLDPQPGWRIADVGCGPGRVRRRTARPRRPGHGDRLGARDARRRRGPRSSAATWSRPTRSSLPLAAGSHDAALSRAGARVHRRSGGRAARGRARRAGPAALVLAADTDWDTQGFNVADRELGRRVVQAWADGKPDGWAGRRLRGWLTAAGLVPEERCAVVLDATEWGGDTFIAHNWPYFRRGLEKAGRVSGRRPRALRGRDRRFRRARRVLLERRAARLARTRARLSVYASAASTSWKNAVTIATASSGHSSRSAWPMSGNSCSRASPGLSSTICRAEKPDFASTGGAEEVVGAVGHAGSGARARARAARDP